MAPGAGSPCRGSDRWGPQARAAGQALRLSELTETPTDTQLDGEAGLVRVKTEDRRQAILEVAHAVFREKGFERASMATISRRLGGSKGTLYGYFKSKEELFETAMKMAGEVAAGQDVEGRVGATGGPFGSLNGRIGTPAPEGLPRPRGTTEDRRQAIVKVALETFRELGFERASMTVIAGRLGRSKGSLYGFFRSKEELFEAAMKAGNQAPGDRIMELLDPEGDDLRVTLTRFAKEYLKFVLSEEVLSITRTAIAEGSTSSLGQHMFKAGPGHALEKMTGFFAEMVRRGKLRDVSPKVAAIQFKSILEGGRLEESLFGVKPLRENTVRGSIDTFLRAYEPMPR